MNGETVIFYRDLKTMQSLRVGRILELLILNIVYSFQSSGKNL